MNEILAGYIESLRPIIYIEDTDFKGIDRLISELAYGTEIFEYINGYGPVDFKTKKPDKKGDEPEPSLSDFLKLYKDRGFDSRVFLVLKNIHKVLDDPVVIEQLRQISEKTSDTQKYHTTVFIVSGTRAIPKELEHLITLFRPGRPEQGSIEDYIKDYAANLRFTVPPDDVGELALALQGLSFFQIKQTLNLCYYHEGTITFKKDKQRILDEKKQMVEKSGVLEFIADRANLEDIGGLGSLKTWLERKKNVFKKLNPALQAGVARPSGVLILGMPGCGKSLAAKTTAKLFGVPLLRLDIGRLLGKYVGESEENMRSALSLAEAVSPCVLWIDEIEKAFAGGGQQGHEVTIRLIGQFLTWMQEKKNTVFVVATANNISTLPPEFLRKGRFDEIFAMDFPDEKARLQILEIHLRKRKQNLQQLNLLPLCGKTDQFSGAELESIVADAVETAFLDSERPVTDKDLLEAVEQTNPLSKSRGDEMKAQRELLDKLAIKKAGGVEKFLPETKQATSSSIDAQKGVNNCKSYFFDVLNIINDEIIKIKLKECDYIGHYLEVNSKLTIIYSMLLEMNNLLFKSIPSRAFKFITGVSDPDAKQICQELIHELSKADNEHFTYENMTGLINCIEELGKKLANSKNKNMALTSAASAFTRACGLSFFMRSEQKKIFRTFQNLDGRIL